MGTGRHWMEKGFAQLMEQAGRKANIVQGAIPRFVQLYATIPFRPREDITYSGYGYGYESFHGLPRGHPSTRTLKPRLR